MNKKIILNAGHSIADPGAVYHGSTESMEARKIRDYLAGLLAENFEVLLVPDHLNLIESIKWVNKKVKKVDDGLAFAIHLNAAFGEGAEAYYYKTNKESKKICETIINKYCDITGYKNRGAKSDSTVRHGRLGWIRDTNCWSTLIEACFISNSRDLDYLHNNLDKVAAGMYEGICDVFKITPDNEKKRLINEARIILNKLDKL